MIQFCKLETQSRTATGASMVQSHRLDLGTPSHARLKQGKRKKSVFQTWERVVDNRKWPPQQEVGELPTLGDVFYRHGLSRMPHAASMSRRQLSRVLRVSCKSWTRSRHNMRVSERNQWINPHRDACIKRVRQRSFGKSQIVYSASSVERNHSPTFEAISFTAIYTGDLDTRRR